MLKKYSDEKRKEVIDARKAGATIAQIAAQTGVGQTTIKIWLKDADSQFGKRDFLQPFVPNSCRNSF